MLRVADVLRVLSRVVVGIVGIRVYSLVFMGIHGYSWVFMGIHGYSLQP